MSDLLEMIRQEVEGREVSECVKTSVNFQKFHLNHQKRGPRMLFCIKMAHDFRQQKIK